MIINVNIQYNCCVFCYFEGIGFEKGEHMDSCLNISERLVTIKKKQKKTNLYVISSSNWLWPQDSVSASSLILIYNTTWEEWKDVRIHPCIDAASVWSQAFSVPLMRGSNRNKLKWCCLHWDEKCALQNWHWKEGSRCYNKWTYMHKFRWSLWNNVQNSDSMKVKAPQIRKLYVFKFLLEM